MSCLLTTNEKLKIEYEVESSCWLDWFNGTGFNINGTHFHKNVGKLSTIVEYEVESSCLN